MNNRLLPFILASLFLLASCASDSTHPQQAGTSTDANQETNAQASTDPGSNQRTRGLNQMDVASSQDIPFDQQFPTLTRVFQNESALLSALMDFYASVSASSMIQSEQELANVLQARDSEMIPRIETALMTIDEDNSLYEEYDALQAELQQLGMQMTFAEGMFTSIGPYQFLEAEIEQYASKAFKLYLEFNQAKTASYNGEYPFLNMEPYLEMIQVGEQLAAIQGNQYFDKIKEDFEQSLLYVSDVHLVDDPTARGESSLFVDGINTEMYPYMTEKESRVAYGNETSGSPFQKAVEKIMANPSTMSTKPEALYLVVIEWADDETVAISRVTNHLRQGEDIPHHLEITLSDGTKKYAIVYRFFEDVGRAEEALASIEGDFPDADLMMVSVKGESLYQIGG